MEPSGGEPKKPAKFDETKFFANLKEVADPGFLKFLRSIDSRAAIEIANYVIRYIRRDEEEALFAARRERLKLRVKALSDAIASLRTAAVKYRAVVAIDVPGAVSSVNDGSPQRQRTSPLITLLEVEAENLDTLLEKQRLLLNEKRFGVTANHLWLVLLQEFVAQWTECELGLARKLRPREIAALVMAGKVTLGWREDKSETDPVLISRAIKNFRSHPGNSALVGPLAMKYAEERCHIVKRRAFILGIKI